MKYLQGVRICNDSVGIGNVGVSRATSGKEIPRVFPTKEGQIVIGDANWTETRIISGSQIAIRWGTAHCWKR